MAFNQTAMTESVRYVADVSQLPAHPDDGETWLKSTSIKERDRLLSLYQVKPIIERLQTALLTSAIFITVSVVALGILSDKVGHSYCIPPSNYKLKYI